jgi:hypothetical protein
MSADGSTVVVGVPAKVTNGVTTGAAYVFVRPPAQSGGWNSTTPIYYEVKLFPSDGATNGLRLGWSADISSNGSTIVLGAIGSSAQGAIAAPTCT